MPRFDGNGRMRRGALGFRPVDVPDPFPYRERPYRVAGRWMPPTPPVRLRRGRFLGAGELASEVWAPGVPWPRNREDPFAYRGVVSVECDPHPLFPERSYCKVKTAAGRKITFDVRRAVFDPDIPYHTRINQARLAYATPDDGIRCLYSSRGDALICGSEREAL